MLMPRLGGRVAATDPPGLRLQSCGHSRVCAKNRAALGTARRWLVASPGNLEHLFAERALPLQAPRRRRDPRRALLAVVYDLSVSHAGQKMQMAKEVAKARLLSCRLATHY